jgi:hypothetical protein
MTASLVERRRRAEEGWAALQRPSRPIIYVGAGSCGLAAGAADIQAAAAECLRNAGVEGRIIPVGCIGPCYLEPLLDVHMPGGPRV